MNQMFGIKEHIKETNKKNIVPSQNNYLYTRKGGEAITTYAWLGNLMKFRIKFHLKKENL